MLCELARTDNHRFRVLEPDSDQTKALRALTRAREDLVGTRTGADATSCARSSSGSGPARSACSPIWTARSRSRSWSATRAPPTRAGWARRACAAFLARERYSGRPEARRSCWPSSGARPRVASASSSWPPAAQLVLALVATIKPLIAQIKELERQIATAIREHPDGEIFLLAVPRPAQRDHRRGAAGRDRRLPRALPDPRRARRRRRPGRRRDRVRQTQGRVLPLGLQQAPARRVLHPGRQHPPLAPLGAGSSTPPPAPAATTTPARYAPSGAPGAGSSGAAGKTARPTTPPATAPCNDTSPSPSPRRRAPCPTSLPPSGWLGAAVTEGRPAGPSAKRLTASRHPLSRPLDPPNAAGLDTGRLLSFCIALLVRHVFDHADEIDGTIASCLAASASGRRDGDEIAELSGGAVTGVPWPDTPDTASYPTASCGASWASRNWLPDGSRSPQSRPYGMSVGAIVNSTPASLRRT